VPSQALAVTEHGSPEEILDLAFRLYDIDGNGTIEMRELSELLRVSKAAKLFFSLLFSFLGIIRVLLILTACNSTSRHFVNFEP